MKDRYRQGRRQDEVAFAGQALLGLDVEPLNGVDRDGVAVQLAELASRIGTRR